MLAQTNQCPQCRAINPRTAQQCIECGDWLPIVNVTGRSAPTSSRTPVVPSLGTPLTSRQKIAWAVGLVFACVIVMISAIQQATQAPRELAAAVVNVRLVPTVTAQGIQTKAVCVDIKNMSNVPIFGVFGMLTLYGPNGEVLESHKKNCLYAAKKGLAPGETYICPSDSGWLYLTEKINGPLARAEAQVTHVDEEFSLDPSVRSTPLNKVTAPVISTLPPVASTVLQEEEPPLPVSFLIFQTETTPKTQTMLVEIAPETPEAKLIEFATKQKPKTRKMLRKDLRVLFFVGGQKKENLIAKYENGKFSPNQTQAVR